MANNFESRVRKASEFKSVSELNLTEETSSIVKKIFPSIEECILFGRRAQYNRVNERTERSLAISRKMGRRHNRGPKSFVTTWCKELIQKLDEVGLIRHVFDDVTINFYILYERGVHSDHKNYYRGVCNPYLVSNERYEEFDGFSDDEKQQAYSILDERLGKSRADIIKNYLGLCDGRMRDISEVIIACDLELSNAEISGRSARRRLRNKCIDEIRRAYYMVYRYDKHCLRFLFEYDHATNMDRVMEIINSPEKSPSLMIELIALSLLPFESALVAREYLGHNGECLSNDIMTLRLSDRVYSCLEKAHIYTIADILSTKCLKELQGIGDKTAWEIERLAHFMGYTDYDPCAVLP